MIEYGKILNQNVIGETITIDLDDENTMKTLVMRIMKIANVEYPKDTDEKIIKHAKEFKYVIINNYKYRKNMKDFCKNALSAFIHFIDSILSDKSIVSLLLAEHFLSVVGFTPIYVNRDESVNDVDINNLKTVLHLPANTELKNSEKITIQNSLIGIIFIIRNGEKTMLSAGEITVRGY